MNHLKRCSKCGVEKPSSKFYKESRSPDGLQSWCKACNAKACKLYRQSAKAQAYKRSPARRAVQARYNHSRAGLARVARHRSSFPEKHEATNALNDAIRAGLLTREPCEICGTEPAQGHHDDYLKPLEVRWLCRKHHMALHSRDSRHSARKFMAWLVLRIRQGSSWVLSRG